MLTPVEEWVPVVPEEEHTSPAPAACSRLELRAAYRPGDAPGRLERPANTREVAAPLLVLPWAAAQEGRIPAS